MISRTEHGRNYRHLNTLSRSTQNMAFQDKYFNGVDIDMSKFYLYFHTTMFQK